MNRYYDNWERLVEVVIKREQIRKLALDSSRSPSTRSIDSDSEFSLSTSSWHDSEYFRQTPSPVHFETITHELAENVREDKQSRAWKNVIFSGFSSKKENAQRTLFGLEPVKKTELLREKYNYKEVTQIADEAKTKVEVNEREQELHTLKGHIESIIKVKGLHIETIHHYYTAGIA